MENHSPTHMQCFPSQLPSKFMDSDWCFQSTVIKKKSVCCHSVTKLCVTLCDPMNYSIPSFLVLHQLLELAQTHVHSVGDAIQPSHPLSIRFSSLSSIFIRVSSNESTLCIRWPKYWSFSFSISLSNEYSGLISFRIDLIWQSKGFSRVFSNTSSKASFLSVQPSLWSNSHIRTWLLEKCMRPCYFGSPTVPCNMDLCVWL